MEVQMNRFTLKQFAVPALLSLSLTCVGCAADKGNGDADNSLAREVVDSVASTFAKRIIEGTHVVAQDSAEVEPESGQPTEVRRVAAMVVVDSVLYATFNRGLAVYDFRSGLVDIIPSESRLTSVLAYEDRLYVGGDQLYQLVDSALVPNPVEMVGAVTSLARYDDRLIIGTTSGLYATGRFGNELLLDDVSVSSLASDQQGLWVGTGGQGLYCYSNGEIKKRFLLRNRSVFDFVNCLAFGPNHLYVGTDEGVFTYNGGRWRQLTIEDGLPDNAIIAVDASSWVVYLSTGSGVVSFFNNEFSPVHKLESEQVNSFCLFGSSIITGTDDHGILMKKGPVLRTLIPPTTGIDIKSISFSVY